MKLQQRYSLNKKAKIREELVCPSCGSKFTKQNYQQAFCKTKTKTQCKDKYWNTVDPNKRNNTTRISPAGASYMASRYNHLKPSVVGGAEKFQGYTSEGYRIWDGVAYNKWDEPVYTVDECDDAHPFDLDY